MAATIPAHAVIASFRFEDGASNALHKLKDISQQQGLGVQNAAVLKVSDDGKLRIQETADLSGGKGMVLGGVVGGVIGLFGSAVIWPLGIGVVAGGLAARLATPGFRTSGSRTSSPNCSRATRCSSWPSTRRPSNRWR